MRTAALDALRDGESRAAAGAARTASDRFPESPGAQVVVNPCLSGGALEIFLEPLLPAPLLDGRRRHADRRRGGDAGADASASRSTGRAGRGADGRRRGGRLQPRRRRGRRRSGPRWTPASASSGWSRSHTRGAALLDELDLHRGRSAPGCTPRSAWTSAPGPRPRSRCRSWPRSCAAVRRRRARPPPPAAAASPRRCRRIDPVCGMTVMVGRRHHRTCRRRRRDHWFCNPGCRDQLRCAGRTSDHVFVTGLVLAAGASRRLGQPKQLLALDGATVLDATARLARAAGFDQLLVAAGRCGRRGPGGRSTSTAHRSWRTPTTAAAARSSIAHGARRAVDPRVDGLVLLLGDQPRRARRDVRDARCDGAWTCAIGVCRYDDGRGHPFWFVGRCSATLERAARRQGGLEAAALRAVPTSSASGSDGPVPLDVDTWADYEALLAEHP